MNKYNNADWTKLARIYGIVAVTIDVNSVGQGNSGISLPCRGCWVQMREGTDSSTKMSIGTPASAVFGVELGRVEYDDLLPEGAFPLWIPVSDVNQLYFYGTPFQTVDITYLLG